MLKMEQVLTMILIMTTMIMMIMMTMVMPVCDEKPISILETGTRISFFQSHFRDEKGNFFLSISCFETRISSFNL